MLLLFVARATCSAPGIYALVGEVGGRTGGAIWTAFGVALVLAVFTAFAYAELVTKYPQAAGAALYVNKAFGVPFVTFMVAFAVMASGITSASTLARAFGGDYLAEFVSVPTVARGPRVHRRRRGGELPRDQRVGEGQRRLTHDRGDRPAAHRRHRGRGAGRRRGRPGPRASSSRRARACVGAMVGGAALAFYALIGFEDSVNVAEETQRPAARLPAGALRRAADRRRHLPRGVAAGVDGRADREPRRLLGPLLEVVQVGPLAVIDEAVRRDRAVRRGQRRAHQHDHGLAADLRDEPAGHRPARLGRCTRAPHAAGVAIVVHDRCSRWSSISTGDLSDLADTTVLLLLVVFAS